MTDYLEESLDKIKHLVSERALRGETMVLNMGPQHPSTHGVLRLILEIDGERIINCIPDVGFLHTGIEKNMEARNYIKAEPSTDRIDYMNTMGNNLVYCLALEKLVGLDVPERATVIRVILAELQRVSSHLLWLGTSILDLGATSPFLYTMREREHILDIFELVSGQRMMTTYIRPGGLWRDVPDSFEKMCRDFVKLMRKRHKEYMDILAKNEILLKRLIGKGVITTEQCFAYGLSGPMIRSTGYEYDLRRAVPYCGYEQYDFDVPTAPDGDVYGRFLVRTEEMLQSLRIIEQALDKMPSGRWRSDDRRFVPPPRSEIGVSMEALIHHFKHWTEGYPAPAEGVYAAIEGPRGEMGVYMEGNGGPKPHRVHYVTPSFVLIQALPLIVKGHMIADVIAAIGSIDCVLGDCDR